MVLQTTNVTLPTSVSLAVVEKAKDTSTIASLSPADTLNGFTDDEYNVFTGAAEAEVVAEGAKKGAYDQAITSVQGKRFTVQSTTRVSKQLQWADEADQLQILNAIQANQSAALGRALDIVIYHALNPKDGTALDGFTALNTQAAQVTAGKDELANIDNLVEAAQDWDITGIAMSRAWAAKLRKLRTSSTGTRLYPEIPLNLQAGSLDGIPAVVSNTVKGAKGHDVNPEIMAFLGDFTTIKWRLARPITAEIIPYGDPDETGTLCTSCRTAYWTLIRQLGHVQLPALTNIMLRQARIGDTIHRPGQGVTSLPIDTTAQQLIDESEAWLAEQAGKIRSAYAAYGWRKAWRVLLANKHTVLAFSTAADDYTALERISRRNETALTPDEERILIGTCPTCHATVYATPEAETATCRNCHGEWPAQALRTTRNERLRKVLITGTPGYVARELQRYHGLTASRNLISQWIRRGKIHATPTNTKGEYDFNLGELVTLLDCHR